MTRAAALAPRSPDLVWFTGGDSVRFLNDLISQEIDRMSPGRVARSLLLEPRGKLDHILWVLRGEGHVALVTDSGRGVELASTLGRYLIRVEVQVEVSTDPIWLIVGDSDVATGEWSLEAGRLIAGLPWRGPRLTLVTGEKPNLPDLTVEEMERIRVEAMEPRFGVDVDGSTIPQESGLVEETVDFSKGCYLGQELVARIDSRGHVNRHLRLLQLADTSIEPGAEITDGDRTVGTMRREVELGTALVVSGGRAVVAR
jgi:tRNA-modifying protein YgfZ